MATDPLSSAVARWSLSCVELVHSRPHAQVYRVRYRGKDAALKLIFDPGAEDRRAPYLLSHWGGVGAVRLLAHSADAQLMEWLAGPPLGDLSRAGQDAESTVILSDVARALHNTPIPPDGLLPIEAHFAPLLQLSTDNPWLVLAQETARHRLAAPEPRRALHGDLHHDNIRAHRAGWRAFDPHALWGPPAYEVANAFRNPIGAEADYCQVERILARAEVFARALTQPPKVLLDWAIAHAGLSVAWEIEAGKTDQCDSPIIPALAAAKAQLGT